MFPTFTQLRNGLQITIANKRAQGHEVEGLHEQLSGLPDSYDAMHDFAGKLADLPLRADWNFVEPDELDEIWAQCDPKRPLGQFRAISSEDALNRIEAAFLGSVCGCVLGKPLEVNPTLEQLQTGLEKVGEWPLRDYLSDEGLTAFGNRHDTWPNTTRDRIHFVEPDDDMNYTILGMLTLEKYGAGFSKANLRDMWLEHLPINTTFGPERTMLARAATHYLEWNGTRGDIDPDGWAQFFNPNDELCGAQIRADAYGYACPGNPALAAELAWRDASFTHRRTGIYATMWTAAAISMAFVARDPIEIFEVANGFVPQRSRFYQIVADSLCEVKAASDWIDGYNRIHGKYKEYTHCGVYQESGTLINTLRFAENVGDGVCKQVSQGNDTDSYGATAGSILGAYFGPGHLEPRWIEPFNDDIHTALAWFFERSLSKLARRMGELPATIGLAHAA